MARANRIALLHRHSPFPAFALASVSLWALDGVPATAQPEPAQALSGPGFIEVVDVEVVNIDVYVTGDDGEPVLGLGPDDFELEVDGRRVPISNFYAVELKDDELWVRRGTEGEAQPLLPPAPEDPLALPAAERAPPSVPAEQTLYVVIYIDNFNLSPFSRNRVMRELRAFIREQLRPEDLVMLASFDRYLNVRLPFTNNREQLNRVLLDLEEVSAQRTHRNSERRDLFEKINDVNTEMVNRRNNDRIVAAERQGLVEGGGLAMARSELLAYAGSVRNDTNVSIDALSSLVQNLSAAPGRKAVIYVADGIPMIAGEDLFYFVNLIYERSVSLIEMTEYDLSRRFQQLAATANANRTSFYTIDARGLTVMSQGTVDSQVAGFPGQMALIDQIAMTNLQSPLRLMAEETGGRSIVNANRVMPDLLKIAADLRNYYSLGYMPGSVGDGRYHTIEVRWKNKPRGAEIRFRRGYRDKSVESQMIEGTLSSLNLNIYENPLDLRIHNLPPKRRSDGNFDVPVVIEAPWKELTLIPRDGVHHGRIELWVAAKDERDRSTEPHLTKLTIAVPEDRVGEIESGVWRYGLELTMEAGYHDIGIGLRDAVSGRHSFLRGGVNVR